MFSKPQLFIQTVHGLSFPVYSPANSHSDNSGGSNFDQPSNQLTSESYQRKDGSQDSGTK
ncbi:hypothetical protein [Planctomycetes bacterium K23_9]|uniref:Uncharacterized protein n=1 Tax=Stieleria marina TaxID=1930275 RepID=A0A517NQZ0_9BACT|nr:hypothetical protein K239x_14870 [Planctomycetes bacterium K23_9]